MMNCFFDVFEEYWEKWLRFFGCIKFVKLFYNYKGVIMIGENSFFERMVDGKLGLGLDIGFVDL